MRAATTGGARRAGWGRGGEQQGALDLAAIYRCPPGRGQGCPIRPTPRTHAQRGHSCGAQLLPPLATSGRPGARRQAPASSSSASGQVDPTPKPRRVWLLLPAKPTAAGRSTTTSLPIEGAVVRTERECSG